MIKECTVSIDQALSLKVNKTHIELLKDYIDKKYVSKVAWQDLEFKKQQCFHQFDLMMEELKKTQEYFEDDLRGQVKIISEKLVHEKFERYDKVHKDFSQFFYTEELNSVIQSKADILLFQELNKKKVSVETY